MTKKACDETKDRGPIVPRNVRGCAFAIKNHTTGGWYEGIRSWSPYIRSWSPCIEDAATYGNEGLAQSEASAIREDLRKAGAMADEVYVYAFVPCRLESRNG